MKNTTFDIRSHSFSAADQLLFDANIWLYIYGPQGSPTNQLTRLYSGAMASVLQNGSSLYVDVLVLSEFINRYARIEHQVKVNSGTAPADFKQFRKSPAFKPIAQSIASDVRRILQNCQRVECGFEILNLTDLLKEFEIGGSDFNDQVLASLCQSRGFTLVTHDLDFYNRGLTIITGNWHLLK